MTPLSEISSAEFITVRMQLKWSHYQRDQAAVKGYLYWLTQSLP
jgi:hypothetical protein